MDQFKIFRTSWALTWKILFFNMS